MSASMLLMVPHLTGQLLSRPARAAGLVAAAVVALVLLTPPPALACSCISPGPACQAFWTTDAVFDGTVVKIEQEEGERIVGPGRTILLTDKVVTLRVNQRWKGIDQAKDVVEVVTSAMGASCGYDFKQGGRYLVFATSGRGDARLGVSLCSFTRPFDGTGDSAAFLASLGAPAAGGRVFGSITAFQRSFKPESSYNERTPMELQVRIDGLGQALTTTSKGGRYEFTGLRPGKYEVDITLPGGYTAWRTTQPVEIPDPRACFEADFGITPAGRIAGRLVDATGHGLTRVEVQVTTHDTLLNQPYLQMVTSQSDGAGYFEVKDLPPGRYVIGLNLRDLPSQFNPYARTLFPGGDQPPTPIELSLGQGVDLGTWTLPPPPAVVRLIGTITWDDGTPAAGVYVSLWDATGTPVDRARGAGGATAGADGRFVVDARDGRTYRFVVRPRGNGPARMLPSPTIEARPGLAPLQLVIPRDPPK